MPDSANEPERSDQDAIPLVVVETDRTHGGFDPRLAAWLADVRRTHQLPFPRLHGPTAAVLAADYVDTAVTRGPDPTWHFRMQLPKAAHLAARAEQPPQLATFHLGSTRSRLQVEGHELAAEVRLTEWLDRWLARRELAPLSSRPRLTGSGIMGDVLASWRTAAEEFVGRYATVRHGPCVFVVALQTPLEHYRRVASDFVIAVSTLRTSRTDGRPEEPGGS